ncbi:hypothetical protein [Streptomyces formicae]|uniref:Secreted protein n=1 Tax=Streptomyces formicae TaxID=1616117 RepID=A0ABY3WTY0_9ACTN|nr:hypothetical protein [Streptomyces formicae]UNM15535.1 hypothetical protein J4032_32350 [Streptomyces formicae]
MVDFMSLAKGAISTRAVALTASVFMGAVGIAAVNADEAHAAGRFFKCATEKSIAGRSVTSKCVVVIGAGGKTASQHRAKADCDMIRGVNSAHDIRVVVDGPWKPLGTPSKVTCPIRSTLVMGYSETK